MAGSPLLLYHRAHQGVMGVISYSTTTILYEESLALKR